MKKYKICLIEVVNRNFGDQVIAQCTYDLITKCIPQKYANEYTIYRYAFSRVDLEVIRNMDMIVFAGGGIFKFRQEKYHIYIPEIINIANEKNIPVYFNAIGVEGYDEEDEGCQKLKEAINSDCVKFITIRDDYDCFIKNYYTNKAIITKNVYDPAITCCDVYGVKEIQNKNTIGLGIIREGIFEEYGNPQITKQVQLDYWKDVIELLEKDNYKWQLFVNGAEKDYVFAREVLEYTGHDRNSNLLVARPASDKELINTINGYAGIIAGRMHSNIIAYSLKVPSIGLVWNDKLHIWGEKSGYPDRMIYPSDFSPKHTVDILIKAIEHGVRKTPAKDVKQLIKPLKKFITANINNLRKKLTPAYYSDIIWDDVLVATALGNIDNRYNNMNNKESFENSVNAGFKSFETDVRITTDNRLVCVNGWSPDTYKKLGLNSEAYDYSGIDYDLFKRSRYYDNHFPTMDFEEFIKLISKVNIDRIFIDIGKPTQETMDNMVKAFLSAPIEEKIMKKMVFRVQKAAYATQIHEANPLWMVAYNLPFGDARIEKEFTISKIMSIKKKYDISYFTFSYGDGIFEDKIVDEINKKDVECCIFSVNTYSQLLKAYSCGFRKIATSFINVKEIKDIT